ncbi:UDP-N-acetylglucosamine 1-carboxyvinyltransferase [candidate division WWE3 bacterium]|uniref:UDP-N-acetylglucosamine 1-carboxyvinyltransferase n=1 Tax=candidate division WWE3 bacterium TaxID=2053526 RepID=A0A955LL60_UNCKA|nr:UDP-N-acetylglucosamine 1-carboxyvinyltransferase [candidate division WWE3 bacterium]
MAIFVVNGGTTLSGEYVLSGAKNAAPKLLIASLLSDQTCTFHNISRFSDTFRSIEAITALGGSVRFTDRNSVEVNCADMFGNEIPVDAMSARQSVLFIGATLARQGYVKIFSPKGDSIGKRPLNRHLDGIVALGGKIIDRGSYMEISMPKRPRPTVYTFEKTTHCGTENLILASVFNLGKVVLKNAAQEPEVDNLIETLNGMGASVKRVSPRVVEVVGVEPLLHGTETTSVYDRLEAATAITLSIMNGGRITVIHTPHELVTEFIKFCEEIGVRFRWNGDKLSITNIKKPLNTANITTSWEPGFMTDWQPLAGLLLATLSRGRSSIHERIYESRWKYLRELAKMGVKYELFQPDGYDAKFYNFNDSEFKPEDYYGAYVYGPTELKPTTVQSHDVRAGIDMLIAALSANGESTIMDPSNHIDRGYENIVEKLIKCGASIVRM